MKKPDNDGKQLPKPNEKTLKETINDFENGPVTFKRIIKGVCEIIKNDFTKKG